MSTEDRKAIENARQNAWNAQAVAQQLRNRVTALESQVEQLTDAVAQLDARLQAFESGVTN